MAQTPLLDRDVTRPAQRRAAVPGFRNWRPGPFEFRGRGAHVIARVRPRPLPELILVAVLFGVYKIGRIAADGHVSRAFADAVRLWHLEAALALPSEASIQHAMLHSLTVTRIANGYYAWVHFPVSVAFLLWIYVYRPRHYVPIRRLMAIVTAIALGVHFLFPLAPPRMFPGRGLIDTAAKYGPSVYGPPKSDSLSNQYAAMPSLHVGWALIVALGLIVATRSRWRWLWLAYPMTTFAVVLGTANHYWMDGIVAIGIVGAVAPFTLRRLSPAATTNGEGTATATDDAAAHVPRQRTAPHPAAPVNAA